MLYISHALSHLQNFKSTGMEILYSAYSEVICVASASLGRLRPPAGQGCYLGWYLSNFVAFLIPRRESQT